MSAILDPALARAIGLGLLHALWQGTLIAVALALALRAIDRRAAALRHALAFFALVLMIAVPAVTAWASYRSLPSVSSAQMTAPASPARAAEVGRMAPVIGPATASGPLAVPSLDAPQLAPRTPLALPDRALSWIAIAWLLGVLFCAGRLFTDALGVHRVARLAEPAPEEWQIRLDRLARRIGVRPMVSLLRSAKVGAPCAIGWLKPVILVPGSAFTGLAPQDLELVLAHELAHIARSDFALNVAQRICEALLFFHPAAHWASAVIRAERENCCDDVAVRSANSPVAYARALTELEALRVGVGTLGPSARVAVSAVGGSLTERVRRLVLPPARHRSPRVAGASALTVLGTLAVIAPLAVGAIAHARPEPATAVSVRPALAQAATGASSHSRVHSSRAASLPGPLLASVTPAPAPAHRHLHRMHQNAAGTPAPDPDTYRADLEEAEADANAAEAFDTDAFGGEDRPRSRVDELVMLKQAGVTPEYVQQMRAAGLNPTSRELVMLASLGMKPEQAKQLSAALGGKLDARQLTRLAQSGVTPEYIDSLRALGFDHLRDRDLMTAHSVGLDAKYVQALRAAGIDTKRFDELVRLKMMGVDPGYVAGLRKAGLQDVDPKQLAQLRAVGVDGDYVAQMKRLGLEPLDTRTLMQLRAMGVTPDYVESLQKAGLAHLSAEQLVHLRASGIDSKFVQDMNRAAPAGQGATR